MAVELTAVAVQTIAPNDNVLFTSTPICCSNGYVVHREGAGIVTIKGITCGQCKARYRVTYGLNFAVSDGGAVGPISVALTINGEQIPSTEAIVTPAAVGDFFSASRTSFIDVPRGCCYTISVENTSDTDIDVSNANIVIERVA